MTRPATSHRLLERLRRMGLDLPPGTTLHRVYAGRADRSNGAWSWAAHRPAGGPHTIGSSFTMTTLVTAPRLIAVEGSDGGDIDVEPTTDTDTATAGGWQRRPHGCRALYERAER